MVKPLSMYPFEYVCESERELPTEEQTVFLLRPMNAFEKQRLDAEIITSDDDKANAKRQLEKSPQVLLMCLIGWRNFGDGGNWERREGITHGTMEQNVSKIPEAVRYELATEVYCRSSMSEDERQNLRSQQAGTSQEVTSEGLVGQETDIAS